MNQSQPRPLTSVQFPLRFLFVVTLVVAVLSGLIRVVPAEVWFYIAFPTSPMLLISASILGTIYLTGQWRAFWLGFGICMLQVLLVGIYTGLRPYRGVNQWFFILVPLFLLMLPAITGGIGIYFFRLGKAQQAASAPGVTGGDATTANAASPNGNAIVGNGHRSEVAERGA